MGRHGIGRLGVVVGVCGMAFVVTAAATAARPVKTPPACRVVAKPVVEAAVGHALQKGERTFHRDIVSKCEYDPVDSVAVTDGIGVSLELSTAGYPYSKKAFKKSNGEARSVSGVGKRAYYAYSTSDGVNLATMMAVDGKNGVVVLLSGFDPLTRDQGLAATTAIATAALQGL